MPRTPRTVDAADTRTWIRTLALGAATGLVFHLSGRLWPAMTLHLAVNLSHMRLLTYPLREL